MFDQDPNEQANISGADFAMMCDENKKLTKQRDDLLAAMEQCREMVGHPDNIAFIDAAIAAAKEGK